MSRFAPVGRARGKLMVAAGRFGSSIRPALAGNGGSDDRVEALCADLLQEPDRRLPGARRQGLAHRSARDSLEVSEVLMQILKNEGPKS